MDKDKARARIRGLSDPFILALAFYLAFLSLSKLTLSPLSHQATPSGTIFCNINKIYRNYILPYQIYYTHLQHVAKTASDVIKCDGDVHFITVIARCVRDIDSEGAQGVEALF